MQNNICTIEDCIEAVTDTVYTPAPFGIETPDQVLMSLSRQIRRGLALTDRQFSMAKEKILKYKDVFETHGVVNLEVVLEQTRNPIRAVDRTKSITIEKFKTKYDTAPPRDYIRIKFPFNKKAMQQISEITSDLNKSEQYFHEKGTHEHFIKLSEINIEKVMEVFSKKNFYIDPMLISMYNDIITVKANPEQYLPCIFQNKIQNLPEHAIGLLEKELGPVTDNTRLLYRDRSIRYGISYYDFDIEMNNISEKIAMRTGPEILVSSSVELSNIVDSLIELKRAPVLVLINDVGKGVEVLNETKRFYEQFSRHFSNAEQSVLFRVDNVPNTYTVNDFIKENSLNNWVDENTKVVYILKSRLPNILVTGQWEPITSISLTSDTSGTLVKEYIKSHCDLILYCESYISSMGKIYKKEKIDVIH